MCPQVYSTQSGARSRHTAHSFDELSSDSVLAATASDARSCEGSRTGAGPRVARGPGGVVAVFAPRRETVATACVGGAGNEVIPAENDDDVVTGVGGSILSADRCDKGRGCFGGSDGGISGDVVVDTDLIIGGGRGGGVLPIAAMVSRRDCHRGGPLITPARQIK